MSDEPLASPDGAAPASRLADAVSIASDFGMVWVLVAIVQVATRRATPLGAARRLAIAGVASLAITRSLKHRFAVPRGTTAVSTLARRPMSERFPSGHTLAAFTAALAVPTSALGRALALAFAAVVGWARVRVGHHEPEDVLAGAAVGALAGGAIAGALAATGSRR